MYADEMDRASEYEYLETQERIREASASKPKRLPVDPGFCDECGGETESKAHLFCSVSCRQKDEKKEKLRRIQGNYTH